MGASGTIAKDQDIEFKALEGSLSMMSKGSSLYSLLHKFLTPFLVLNDILDL
jgi:hypothetical protein